MEPKPFLIQPGSLTLPGANSTVRSAAKTDYSVDAAFGQFHGDLLPVDQADLVRPKFLLRPKLSRELVIGQNRNALLLHLGEELRGVAFTVEDDREATQKRVGFQLFFSRLVGYIGCKPWDDALA